MNLELIKSKFKSINNLYFEKENNNLFLRIEVNLHTLEAVTKISKEILSFIDQIKLDRQEFLLDVFSGGAEKMISKNDLEDALTKQVMITYHDQDKEKIIEGKIERYTTDEVAISYFYKHQKKNKLISLDNIRKIKLLVNI